MLFNSRPVTSEKESSIKKKSVKFDEWGTQDHESSLRAETNFVPVDEEALLRS